MSETTFISKYKPYYISDFYTDENFQFVLNTLFEIDNLNVLFVGNPSSGKTTLLYAIIRQYYGLSKESTFPENNILHINNLKEQGINYYRNDVKTFCQTCSSVKGKKKIIVLDDIDIINEQSQQVFRNCIDKYSHNVQFISSCSNSQKVIESLQSRLMIIKIKPLQKENLHKIMKKIIASENIVISEAAERFILTVCNNNAKILINYMEKFKLLNQIVDLDLATNVCTNISFTTFEEYTTLLKNSNTRSSSTYRLTSSPRSTARGLKKSRRAKRHYSKKTRKYKK
jgi:DNA polymerase III delta prime subunit